MNAYQVFLWRFYFLILLGDADGKGNIRKEELYEACAVLKVIWKIWAFSIQQAVKLKSKPSSTIADIVYIATVASVNFPSPSSIINLVLSEINLVLP